jgi:hypothetical protein
VGLATTVDGPDPWRPEDEWGSLAAAVLIFIIFIILAGLMVYASAVFGNAERHFNSPKRDPRPSPKGAWCGLNVL